MLVLRGDRNGCFHAFFPSEAELQIDFVSVGSSSAIPGNSGWAAFEAGHAGSAIRPRSALPGEIRS
jgi:hypothetical protein